MGECRPGVPCPARTRRAEPIGQDALPMNRRQIRPAHDVLLTPRLRRARGLNISTTLEAYWYQRSLTWVTHSLICCSEASVISSDEAESRLADISRRCSWAF